MNCLLGTVRDILEGPFMHTENDNFPCPLYAPTQLEKASPFGGAYPYTGNGLGRPLWIKDYNLVSKENKTLCFLSGIDTLSLLSTGSC